MSHLQTYEKPKASATHKDATINEKQGVTKSSLTFPISSSKILQAHLGGLEKFLYAKLYHHPRVAKMSEQGMRIIEVLFKHFLTHPRKMPEHYQKHIENDGLHRIVSDYIAGMTDRFAHKEYDRIQ